MIAVIEDAPHLNAMVTIEGELDTIVSLLFQGPAIASSSTYLLSPLVDLESRVGQSILSGKGKPN